MDYKSGNILKIQWNKVYRRYYIRWIKLYETIIKTNLIKGVEFTEENEGRKLKSIVNSEGPDKLIQSLTDIKTGKIFSNVTREIDNKDQLIIVIVFLFILFGINTSLINNLIK